MTLRLSDEQTEALRRKAEAEHRSMQQVALAAIDAYVQQATPSRRQSVPATELMTVFQDLPPMSAEALRADSGSLRRRRGIPRRLRTHPRA